MRQTNHEAPDACRVDLRRKLSAPGRGDRSRHGLKFSGRIVRARLHSASSKCVFGKRRDLRALSIRGKRRHCLPFRFLVARGRRWTAFDRANNDHIGPRPCSKFPVRAKPIDDSPLPPREDLVRQSMEVPKQPKQVNAL